MYEVVFDVDEFESCMFKFFCLNKGQRDELKSKFAENLITWLYYYCPGIQINEQQDVINNCLSKVYTIENFQLIQHYAELECLTTLNLGLENSIWVKSLIDYISGGEGTYEAI